VTVVGGGKRFFRLTAPRARAARRCG
jgi:hypothetical protein